MSLNAPPHINNGGSLVWIGRAAKESQDRLERPWDGAGQATKVMKFSIRSEEGAPSVSGVLFSPREIRES